MNDDFRPIGPGRYAITLVLPCGQALPAELILTTRRAWPARPEARDARWSAFGIGPVAVFAVRLLAEIPTAAPRPLVRSPVPAEWN